MGATVDTPSDDGAGADLLRASDVSTVFQEFLGRPASPADVENWLRAGTLGALLDGVLSSAEYRQRHKANVQRRPSQHGPVYLNCWVEGWEAYSRPVGEVSEDGVAIVGEQGHLFIHGGSNNNVASHRGESPLPPNWLDSWRSLVTDRVAHAQRTGRSLAMLVVPEKLAVCGELFPGDLTSVGRRPVLSLLEDAELPIVYPDAALREARAQGETYLRTDSHLTLRGNRILAAAVAQAVGLAASALGLDEPAAPRYLAAGDLGAHFDPAVLEVMAPGGRASLAEVVSDNRAQVAAVGGHVGTVRVFHNDRAPDGRVAVVFGDSYGFGDDSYRGLAWFLAQAFREVHFLWVPFGWDPDYLDAVDADVIVCQTAERFTGRVPLARVDVRALARETLARGAALTPGEIFDDA